MYISSFSFSSGFLAKGEIVSSPVLQLHTGLAVKAIQACNSGGGTGKRNYFARVKGKIETRGSQIMKESLVCMKTCHFSKCHTESTGNQVTVV